MTSSSLRARVAAGGLLLASLGTVVVTACTTETLSNARLCTPNAYVYCRCKDPNSEGTKQCQSDGQSFAECDCGFSGGQLNPGGGFAGFEPVDGGTTSGTSIDEKCAGKVAVLAGSQESLDVYGISYAGNGKWPLGVSTGAALRSTPRGGLVGSSLIAVWQTRQSLMAWTKFEAGQTALTPPTSMGGFTVAPPDFLGGAQGTLFYQVAAPNGTGPSAVVTSTPDLATSTYSTTAGWPETDTIDPTKIPGTSTTKTPPSAVILGTGYAIAFATGSDLSGVAVQVSDGTTWGAATTIAGATNYNGLTPTIGALGGTEDLIVVYQGPDLKLRSATRVKATAKWNTPILVDTAANPNGAPAMTTMADGRAILVWRGADNTPAFSVYADGKWSNPNGVGASSPKLLTPPAVVAGRCASDATVTYVDGTGTVWLAFYKNGAFGDAVQVPGVKGVTYAATGEVP